MKRIFLTALMLLAASSLFAADHYNKGGGKNKAQGNKAGLEQTVKEFLEAVKANDLKKVGSYYIADYTFTGPDGKMVSGDERLKHMAAAPATTLAFSDINVRTYEGTGVVTGTATTKNAGGGTDQTRFTQAWTWQGGHWRLAASQLTRVAP